MKLRTDPWFILSRIGTLSMALTLLPACSASAGHRAAKADCPPGSEPSRSIAYRPIFSNLPTRTFYPSGYAGATYPPLGQGDRAAVRSARRPIYSGWFGGR
ncbi:hypothetical protein [Singulisphaera acidiphila]|uniref:Lipoprotein n=1 Tax=Singulisphaera acidiphila (strain ATCC BAA-1392 / DSM 18658 / VKM B-2454 / MOB10) TaxID=886293 RepID=L0DC96_SINAD|nr:hypothetical protein [Singulisphaera acidiphila]AGA26291.1 hypothetical protein Sinac_1930 [Singulisphaera acidiphila DSM 18658]